MRQAHSHQHCSKIPFLTVAITSQYTIFIQNAIYILANWQKPFIPLQIWGQPTDETKPVVVTPQHNSMEMSAYLNGAMTAQMFSAQNPAAIYNPSMFSLMQAQQPNNMGAAIVRDLFQRQKEKIMYLQNITLGDEEISACLSRMFSRRCLCCFLLAVNPRVMFIKKFFLPRFYVLRLIVNFFFFFFFEVA